MEGVRTNPRIPGLRLPAARRTGGGIRRAHHAADGRPVAGLRLDGRARPHRAGRGRRRHARRGRRRLHPPQGAVESRDAHRSPRGADRRRARKHGAPGRARKTPLPDGRVGSGPQRLQRGAAYRRHARRSQGVRPDGAGDTGIPIQRYIQPLK